MIDRLYTIFENCITFADIYSCSQHTCANACHSTNEQICAFKNGKCLVDKTNKPTKIHTTEKHEDCEKKIVKERPKQTPIPSVPEPSQLPDVVTDANSTDLPEMSLGEQVEEDKVEIDDPDQPVHEPISQAGFFESLNMYDAGKIVGGLAVGVVLGVLVAFFACRRPTRHPSNCGSKKSTRHNSEKSVRASQGENRPNWARVK